MLESVGCVLSYYTNLIGLEINFEESDYSITEGSGLTTPITLQFRNNQNAFTITFAPVTIDAVEGMSLGRNFINSETILEESRAEPGNVLILVKRCNCSQFSYKVYNRSRLYNFQVVITISPKHLCSIFM